MFSRGFYFFLIAFLINVAILLWRVFPEVMSPTLNSDDGAFFLPLFSGSSNPVNVFWQTVNYTPLTVNLTAYLLCRLPYAIIPHAFVLASLSLHAASLSVITLPRFRTWCSDDVLRFLISILLCTFPMTGIWCVTALAWTQWSWLLIGTMLSSVTVDRRSVLPIALSILSCPLGIATAPILMIRWPFSDSSERRRLLGLVALAVTWNLYAVLSSHTGQTSVRSANFASEHRLQRLIEFDVYFVWIRGVFGNRVFEHLWLQRSVIIEFLDQAVIFLAIFAVVGWTIQNIRQRRKMTTHQWAFWRFVVTAVGVLAFFSLTSIYLRSSAMTLTVIDGMVAPLNVRYLMVPTAWLIVLLVLLTTRKMSIPLGRATVICLLLWAGSLNLHRSNRLTYETSVPEQREDVRLWRQQYPELAAQGKPLIWGAIRRARFARDSPMAEWSLILMPINPQTREYCSKYYGRTADIVNHAKNEEWPIYGNLQFWRPPPETFAPENEGNQSKSID